MFDQDFLSVNEGIQFELRPTLGCCVLARLEKKDTRLIPLFAKLLNLIAAMAEIILSPAWMTVMIAQMNILLLLPESILATMDYLFIAISTLQKIKQPFSI